MPTNTPSSLITIPAPDATTPVSPEPFPIKLVAVTIPDALMFVALRFVIVPVVLLKVVEVIIPTVTCEPEFNGGCASIDIVEADPEVAIAVIANPTKLSVLTLLATRLPSSLIVTPEKFCGKSIS